MVVFAEHHLQVFDFVVAFYSVSSLPRMRAAQARNHNPVGSGCGYSNKTRSFSIEALTCRIVDSRLRGNDGNIAESAPKPGRTQFMGLTIKILHISFTRLSIYFKSISKEI
jgi:hypothetical protein